MFCPFPYHKRLITQAIKLDMIGFFNVRLAYCTDTHCVRTNSFSNWPPATITISSPDCKTCFNCFTFSNFWTYHQLKMDTVNIGINNSQFNINPRSVICRMSLKISAFGRYLEIKRAVCPVLCYNQFNVHWVSSTFNSWSHYFCLRVTFEWIWVQTTVFVKKSLSVLSIVATVTDSSGYLPFADSPEHCSVSSIDNSVENVWLLNELNRVYHCFKHVCCSDNNFTCSTLTFLMIIFCNWTISYGTGYPCHHEQSYHQQLSDDFIQVVDTCWFSILANNWTCPFPVSLQIAWTSSNIFTVRTNEIAIKLDTLLKTKADITFSKSWERNS